MKKNVYFCSILMILLSSCSLLVKKTAGFRDIKVESKESISKFLTKTKSPLHNNYILKGSNDSIVIFNNIKKSFNNEILLFDSTGIKYCYSGDETCTGVQLKEAIYEFDKNYQPCVIDTFNFINFLTNIESIDTSSNSQGLVKADYYLIVFWSKFFGRKKMKEIEWLNSLQNESKKEIAIIFVNTDLQTSWGLEEGKKMKLKLKFKGDKSASLKFGKIPYDRKY